MDAHGVEVLDGADDDHVVGAVAHHLELELLPPEHRLLHEDLTDGRSVQPAPRHGDEILLGCGDAGTTAAENVRRSDHHRIADLAGGAHRFGHGARIDRSRHLEAGALHDLLEATPVLGRFDGVETGPDQLHLVAVQHSAPCQLGGDVEGRLAAQRGQEGLRPLPSDDLLDHLGGDRLQVGGIGELGIRHDRGRVGIGQHHPVAVPAQHLGGLGSRVVELAGLPDHDGPGTDHENAVQVGSGRHHSAISSTKRSKSPSESRGPGAASGWYCTEKAGTSWQLRPSRVPSLRF